MQNRIWTVCCQETSLTVVQNDTISTSGQNQDCSYPVWELFLLAIRIQEVPVDIAKPLGYT